MNKIKYTIPFLALILLIPIGMTNSFAQEPGEEEFTEKIGPVTNVTEEIDTLGNRGVQIQELLKVITNEQQISELEAEFDDIKETMRTLGIPTVEEYETNKAYWRQIAAEHHLAEEESEHDDSISNVSFVSHRCSDCDVVPEVKFQSGYGYDCYSGLWTCHAFAPIWEKLRDGYMGNQLLTVGNSHDWMDPFWLMQANKRLNVNYSYEHNMENQYGTVISTDENGNVQYFPTSSSVRTVDMDRVDDPRQNYSIHNQLEINSLS